jgi:hypothetical protein
MPRLALVTLALVLAGGCRRTPANAPAEAGGPEQPKPELELEERPVAPPPSCDGQPCNPPRECISYYGIAGPSGPMFHACEIRCELGRGPDGCPEGTRCVTIADGPGEVCR